MLVLLVALLSGALSILTPCVLPLLPAILAATAGAGRRRPVGIVLGLVTSFTLALLAFSALVRALDVPSQSLRWVAAGMLLAFGAVLVVPPLHRWFEQRASTLARFAPSAGRDGDGLWSGIAVGAGLGFVWAPCVGPILGGVAVASSTSGTTGAHVARAIAFAVGMSIPLLAIVFGGQRAGAALRARVNPRLVQGVVGIVFLATGTMVAADLDTRLNAFLSRTTGISSTIIADLESDVIRDQDGDTRFSRPSTQRDTGAALPQLGDAPDLRGITQWINTPGERPLSLTRELRDKVVLVDFWTYSCINCLRTLPYLRSWHERYADDGLVIVGVHAPEFEFEKDEGNVRDAIREHRIEYPVAMDNDFATWRAYDNRYWPAKYLIDRTGQVRYTHFGEGDYDETELAVRELLGLERTEMTANPEPDANLAGTPETYLGAERAANFVGSTVTGEAGAFDTGKMAAYAGPDADELGRTEWTLRGSWSVNDERSLAGEGASLELHYVAADVHLVLGPAGGDGGTVVVRDSAAEEGAAPKRIRVNEHRLYTLRSSEQRADGVISIDVPPGVAAYAFTFG